MAAVGLDNDVFTTVSALAKAHGTTTQEVVTTLVRMQLEGLGEQGLRELAFRKGRRPRKKTDSKQSEAAPVAEAVPVSESNSETATQVGTTP